MKSFEERGEWEGMPKQRNSQKSAKLRLAVVGKKVLVISVSGRFGVGWEWKESLLDWLVVEKCFL